MTNKLIVGFLLVLFLFSIPIAAVSSQSGTKRQSHYVEGEILVKFKADFAPYEDRGQIAEDLFPAHGTRSQALPQTEDRNLRLIRLTESLSVEEAVSRAQADPRVEHAEPNYLYYTKETTPNDEWFPQQWGVFDGRCRCDPSGHIGTLRAWDLTTGSDEIVVAVIDTGVDLAHPDLAPNAWVNPGEIPANGQDDDGNGFIDDVNGWNFANNNNSVYKDHNTDFHGTHVAGTIGAVGNNQIGVAGVAWHVKLMSAKFIGRKSGEGSVADAIKAIEYVTAQKKRGVNVRAINASWGGPGNSSLLRDAIVKAGKAGILFVCAAGNETEDVDVLPSYPVGFSGDISTLISVAATMPGEGNIAGFSNFGHRTVSVGAPGSDVMSVRADGGYGPLTGTSMAAPHVTGIAVLLWAQEPSLTPAQVKQRILMTAEPRPSLASRSVSAGLANAHNALINRIPTVAPVIWEVSVEKKKIVLDGVGFVSGSSIIEVDRLPVPVTEYDESYVVPSGAVTRLRANLGKKAMKSFFPKGVWVSVQVYDPATARWSPPWNAVRP